MILFELKCARNHRFEAWFRNGDAYEQQAGSGLIACPVCGDSSVEKAPMAPHLLKGRSMPARAAEENPTPLPEQAAPLDADAAKLHTILKALHAHVQENCDYVGEQFPEEARKIHYGETEARAIYGEANQEDAEALRDEGISFSILPVLPREN